MDSIAVRNFRCFQSTEEISIRPITLLIGENSTGKSSFLAAIRLAWDAAYSARPLDFNEEPFLLGAYEQLAHYRGGKAGRAKSFEIHSSLSVRPAKQLEIESVERVPLRFHTTFVQAGSHPVISKQSVEYAGHTLTADFSAPDSVMKLQLTWNEGNVTVPLMGRGRNYRFTAGSPIDWSLLIFLMMRESDIADQDGGFKRNLTPIQSAILDDIMKHTRTRRRDRPIAIAPVRTRPLRTYNPISVAPLPQGDHVPMVLAKTYFDEKKKWELLMSALHQFGLESGMFDELYIKPLGRSESEPFQLRVKIQGPAANLIDVGYGVSQVLPVLVDSILASKGETFLVQQPEVHLHPKAQAALGSFLVRMSLEYGKRFIIESHSDYLIDRIRSEIRNHKRAKPSDVSLLYFERTGIEVQIRNLHLDEVGNIVNPPLGYRDFFLREERRILGV